MIQLYLPGTSPIHRMPAAVKVLVFALVALGITVSARNPLTLPITTAVVVAAYLMAGFGLDTLFRQIVTVRWLIAVMLISQLFFVPVMTVLGNTGRVVLVVVLASLITLTTRIPALLDATETTLAPFRRFGVNPAKIGLLLALSITAIPVISGFAALIRDAQRARGMPVRIHTFTVPLLVMSLKHSDELADALIARGLD